MILVSKFDKKICSFKVILNNMITDGLKMMMMILKKKKMKHLWSWVG